MNNLRVAVFNTQPPHLFIGGVEQRIIKVSTKLAKKVNTTVYSGTKNGFKNTTVQNGMTVVPCFSTDMLFPVDNWTFCRSVESMFDAIKADVYESHNVSGYGVLRALKKRKMCSQLIQTIHGPLIDEYVQAKRFAAQTFRNRLNNWAMQRLSRIEQDLAQDSGLVVTVSNYASKQIVKHYNINPNKIRIVPNGVDTSKFRPTQAPETLKQKMGIAEKRCLLFVGRLVPRKGLLFLVEAAERIVKEQKDTVFMLAGDGPQRPVLVKELKNRGLSDYFMFLGDIWGEDVPKIYSCADVFVFPSIQEGQGIALLEAQASAKPVVGFNVSAVKEVVMHNETGLLVNPNSCEFADAVLNLLSDQALSEKMGCAGREFVMNNFSWDICAQKMLKAYQEVAG